MQHVQTELVQRGIAELGVQSAAIDLLQHP
jgi:hypothetical protein